MERVGESDTTSEWEVVTACDISLGALMPKDHYIDISHDAIDDILHTLDPHSSGVKLSFTAVRDDHYTFNRDIVAGNARHEANNNEIIVNVAIGGEKTLRKNLIQYEEEVARMEDDDYLKTLNSETILSGIVWSRSNEWIQKASVHELQHSVDFINKGVQKKDKIGKVVMLAKHAAIHTISSNAAGWGTYLGAMELTKNTSSSIYAGLGAFMLCNLGMSLARRKHLEKYELFSTLMEQRAYATQELSQTLPTIISFKND